jgi:hypothetical protein
MGSRGRDVLGGSSVAEAIVRIGPDPTTAFVAKQSWERPTAWRLLRRRSSGATEGGRKMAAIIRTVTRTPEIL